MNNTNNFNVITIDQLIIAEMYKKQSTTVSYRSVKKFGQKLSSNLKKTQPFFVVCYSERYLEELIKTNDLFIISKNNIMINQDKTIRDVKNFISNIPKDIRVIIFENKSGFFTYL